MNHKRVGRLYAEEKLHIKRRRRKKVPVSERQPLVRPTAANQVWSKDFVFDRVASGRSLKCLGIVDDGTHEAVAVHPEHALGGDHLVRILTLICHRRGYLKIIRTDNGKEFTGKPNQNAYIESFNGRLRDECLNEHWFRNIHHARELIGAWQKVYNEERPKKGLAGLTPSQYAKRLVEKKVTINAGL